MALAIYLATLALFFNHFRKLATHQLAKRLIGNSFLFGVADPALLHGCRINNLNHKNTANQDRMIDHIQCPLSVGFLFILYNCFLIVIWVEGRLVILR